MSAFFLYDKESVTVDFQVNDENGDPLNCTGLDLIMSLDRQRGGAHVTKTASWDVRSTGDAYFEFQTADYDTIRPGVYDFTVWLTDGASRHDVVLQDTIEVRRAQART